MQCPKDMFTRMRDDAHVMRRSRAKSTSFETDRRRGLITSACLSVILAIAMIASGTVAKNSGSSGGYLGREGNYASGSGELQSGAILYVPLEGNVCRKRAIDNESWRIRDDGYVVCDEAVTWNSSAQGQKYFVTVRVDAIRAGFKANQK